MGFLISAISFGVQKGLGFGWVVAMIFAMFSSAYGGAEELVSKSHDFGWVVDLVFAMFCAAFGGGGAPV
jgi:hypothetical protein